MWSLKNFWHIYHVWLLYMGTCFFSSGRIKIKLHGVYECSRKESPAHKAQCSGNHAAVCSQRLWDYDSSHGTSSSRKSRNVIWSYRCIEHCALSRYYLHTLNSKIVKKRKRRKKDSTPLKTVQDKKQTFSYTQDKTITLVIIQKRIGLV